MKATTVRLPPELLQHLELLALHEGRSESDLVREAVAAWTTARLTAVDVGVAFKAELAEIERRRGRVARSHQLLAVLKDDVEGASELRAADG